MRLTVLGKSPSWQDADGACSGYLIEDGDTAALVDCGNGVFSKLRRFRDYIHVDGVVISHMHADHFLDLIPFSYALTYAPRRQPVPVDRWPGIEEPPPKPLLHVPPGASEVFRQVCGAWNQPELILDAFTCTEYSAEEEPEIGSLRFRFHSVPHYLETFAIEVTSTNGGGRLVYGADSSPCDALVDFARDCDLLVVEATLPRPERSGVRGHLTPREAGEHGREAGARAILLTHISDELDSLWALKEARAAFDGPVHIAREGAVFDL